MQSCMWEANGSYSCSGGSVVSRGLERFTSGTAHVQRFTSGTAHVQHTLEPPSRAGAASHEGFHSMGNKAQIAQLQKQYATQPTPPASKPKAAK
jgi:hypothetical protein